MAPSALTQEMARYEIAELRARCEWDSGFVQA
jgi:hypothetical protein